MFSEKLISEITNVVSETFSQFEKAQREIDLVYQKYLLKPSGTFSISSELSFQIENAIIQKIKFCEKGKQYEDVLYKNKFPLEVKVSVRNSLMVNLKHKVCGKTYLHIQRENLVPKRLIILPFARDCFFKKPSANSQNRTFDKKYKNSLIKINF